MSAVMWTALGIFSLAVLFAVGRVVQAFVRSRGTRVIICPETHEPAAVCLDSTRAVLAATVGGPALRLASCSRWPERFGCNQPCLEQIATAPDGCLVRSMLSKWYASRRCAICDKAFGQIDWHAPAPALMTPQSRTLEWREIPPEKLPGVLGTHLPVCAGCHAAEAFRRRFPQLVTDRPERSHLST